MEEDETPRVFENHMQIEENLVEMQRFASQNGYPAAISHSKLWRHCTSDVSALNQQEIIIFHLSSFTWILQEAKKV